MPNPVTIDILRELRESAGLNQVKAAKLCGLTSKQGRLSLAAWEQGESIPRATRRAKFMGYLWDGLGLRTDPEKFERVWETLVQEWRWDPIEDREWGRLTKVERPSRNGAGYASRPFQALASIPHFVGRQQELDAACDQLIDQSGPSAIAFVGMGGIGKTTLATHAAHALRDHFADGILWANVATANPLDIAQSWAQAYGYDFSGLSDLESRAAAIRNVLAEKHVLIIFDDVIDAAVVRPLLPGGDRCRVLITSRNHDIASTLNAQPLSPPELTTEAGVDLLVRVLGAPRVDAELESAQRICEIVEGLPLAVEIVAQRLFSRPQQSLGNMVARLEDAVNRLDSLQIGDRAVRAAFEVSWSQLDEEQQRIFSLIGVFEGHSFPILALAYIAELEEGEIYDQLLELNALSLVKHEANIRYHQHQLLADFALEKLANNVVAYKRLTAFYVGYLERQGSNCLEIGAEWNCIMFAMEIAYRLEEWPMVLNFMEQLHKPWQILGEYTRAKQGFTMACDAAQKMRIPNKEAFCLLELGRVCYEQGNYPESKQHLDNAILITNLINDCLISADAYYILAGLSIEQGDYEIADENITQCYSQYKALNDLCGISKAIYMRAILLLYTADYAESELLCNQALQLQEEGQFLPELIETLQVLTDISLARRNHDRAHEYCKKAIDLSIQQNRVAKLGECYLSFAQIHRRRSEWKSAWYWAEQGIIIFKSTGQRAYYAYALFEQSISKAELGDVEQAIKIGKCSLSIVTELNNNYNRVTYLITIGDFYARIGKNGEARMLWEDGFALAQSIRHPNVHELSSRLAPTLLEHVDEGVLA